MNPTFRLPFALAVAVTLALCLAPAMGRAGRATAPAADHLDDVHLQAPAGFAGGGLARGRMCSKDKECASGVCEMENRTRGRCK